MNLPEDFVPGLPGAEALDMSDKWVLTKLGQTAAAMTDNIDHYELGLAAAKINTLSGMCTATGSSRSPSPG